MRGSETKNERKGIEFSYTASTNVLEEENKLLKETVNQLREELNRFRSPALMVAEVSEIFGEQAIIRIPNGNKFYVNCSKAVKNLAAGDTVLVEQKNLTIVDKTVTTKNFDVDKYIIMEKPIITWTDVGGLDQQCEDVREVIELPLQHPELFEQIGITPPKGILLHGPPGTGKTLLAKAVANSTNSTFIEIVASELVQKFIGEGAKLVKEIFDLAREKGPAIIFIDELDALAARRIDIGTSGEREVQRTFMQLLAEIDGFKPLDNVKVIGCTNRRDILDPAILRPGRLDRLIEVPHPSIEGVREIFKIHTRRMHMEKIATEAVVNKMKDFSGAEIKAVCTEAGYFAIREKRKIVKQKDFLDAVIKVKAREEQEGTDYLQMFG